MNFQQFINIIIFRKTVVLTVLLVIVVTTLLVTLALPKKYVATVSLVADQRSVDPMSGLTLPTQMMPWYIKTQADVIASHNVARKVVEKLNLIENPQILKFLSETKVKSVGDARDLVADLLLKKLKIRSSHETSLIHIDFSFNDPQLAANIANVFAEAYIQTKIELRAQPAKLSAAWFDSELVSLRENLERAQSVLSTYQQQHEIVEVDDRLGLEYTHLSELSRQLIESQARTRELQSRKDSLASAVEQGDLSESMEEVLSNTFIQALKSELARAEANFAELSKRVDKNHPQYIQARAQVYNLQWKIKSEIKKIKNNIVGKLESSNQRNKILTAALAKQKIKVLELKQQHDKIAVLKREVDNASRLYDSALQRAAQSRMESEMNQTNVAILNRAIPPQEPTSPKLRLNMILSVFLGTILGVGLAILLELKDRRVRSAYDITEAISLPVFTVISVPASESESTMLPNYAQKLLKWMRD